MVRQDALARSIFSGISSSYDNVVNLMTLQQDRAWKRRMLERLRVPRGARVLDIGCGTGILEESSPLDTSEVVGVDITSRMVRSAQSKKLRMTLGLADAEHLPFSPGSFDFVVSCYVPKYCNTRTFVEEIARVLKPGGRMAVYDFTKPSGTLALPLDLYVKGILPLFGRLVAPIVPSLGFTYAALPGLIDSSSWKEELGPALRDNGIFDVESRAMTGGIVTVFWASKPLLY